MRFLLPMMLAAAALPLPGQAQAPAEAVRHLQALRRIELLANAGDPGQAARAAETLLAEDRARAELPSPALALRWRFQSMLAAARLHELLGHDERALALYREILDSYGPGDADFAPRALLDSIRGLDKLCARTGQPAVAVRYLAAFLAQPSMQAPANREVRVLLGQRLGKAALEANDWNVAETSLLQAMDDAMNSAGVTLPLGIGGDSPLTARHGDLTTLANYQQLIRERLAATGMVQSLSDAEGRQLPRQPNPDGWLDVDTPAANLARLYHLRGQADALERFYRGPFAAYAARIQSVHQDDGYADLEKEYARIGLYLGAAGRWDAAGAALQQALRLNNLWQQAYAHGAPPDQLRRTFARRRELRDMLVSWHMRAETPQAERQAMLGEVLQDKALTQEMLARRAHAVRHSDDAQVHRLQEQIEASDGLASAESLALRMNLEQALQARIGSAIEPLRFAPGADFIGRAMRALDGATLVSITSWRPFDFAAQAFAAPHYLGAVVEARGARVVDLGPAAAIDPLLGALRAELSTAPGPGREAQALKLARAAYATLLAPLLGARPAAGSYLAELDGNAAQVPLEALADADGHYLIEAHTWRYLDSVRVLVDPPAPSRTDDTAEILMDADYDARLRNVDSADAAALAGGSRLDALRALRFRPLPSTRAEGLAVAGALERRGAKVTLHAGADASAAALRRVHAPRWLHLATHGFYLEEAGIVREQVRGTDGKDYLVERYAQDLGSGLALAGANAALADGAAGAGNGLLYAADLRSLDLEGTELVVLSACDSARGAVAVGETVASLRQAIGIAGARTSLTSLWSVPDRGAMELMADFYGRLASGAGKAAALRSAKLAAKAARPHPFYWAPFILSGAD